MGLTRPRAYQIFDIDYKQAVRVVQTSNVTLSGGAPATVDGVSLSLNDRVLVTGQSTASQNGLYYVTTVGTGSNGTWSRSVDGNETGEIQAGLIVMVTQGTSYADTQWKLTTDDPITIGVTSLVFVLNVGSVVGGLTTQVQFNDGGVMGGTAGFTFDKTTNAVSTTGTVTATGNITGGNLSGTLVSGTLSTAAQPNITSVGTLSSLGVTGNITGGNISTAGQLKTTGTFLIGTQEFYAQGSDGFSVNENFNAGNATVTAYHYTSGAGRNAIVFDTAVTGQFTTGFGTTGTAASNKFVFFAEFGNTFWEWRKSVGIQAPNLNGGTLLANISADGNLWTAGTITGTGNITGGNISTAGTLSVGLVSGNLIPNANITYSLGNTTNRWKDLWISNSTIYIGETNISASGTTLQVGGTNVVTQTASGNITGGNISVTGLVSATNFIGNGYTLTSVNASNISGTVANATYATSAGSATTATSATSATTAGTVTTAAQPNITSVGTLSSLMVTGNVTGGNLSAGTGTITVGGLTFNGNTITSSGSTLTIDPNSSGGTDGLVTIAGNLQVQGNVTYINSNVISVNDLLFNVANNAATASAANGGGLGVGPVDAEYAKITYNSTSNTWVISNGANVSGVVTATGNITGLNFIGNGSTLTNVTGANVTGTVANATYATSAGSATTAGTVTTAAQPNITSVGTLSSLTVTANVTGGNLTTGSQVVATGNITGGNVNTAGKVTASTLQSNVATGTAPLTVTSTTRVSNLNAAYAGSADYVGAGSALNGNFYVTLQSSLSSNVQALGNAAFIANASTGAFYATTYYGSGAGLTSIPGGNVSGTVATATTAGTVTTASQPNITSVGTLSSLAVTGNTTSGNFVGTLNGSGANVTSISATNISAGTLAQARLANSAVTLGSTALTLGATVTTVTGLSSVTSTTFVGALTGAATTAGTVTTAAQPNITSVGTLSSLTVTANVAGGNLTTAGQVSATGNITGGNLITAGLVSLSSITKTGSNGVGNIGAVGSYFNTVFAKATSAQYADLAEMYVADANYQPGTVVEFGGDKEVTQTTASCSTAVAGIISTNPSYLMNSCQEGEYVLPVALTGRVPCRVQGPVKKGDVLVSSNVPGVAQRIGANWQPGCTVGKAMEVIETSEIQIIEVAVGRL